MTNSASIEIVSVTLYHKNAKPRLFACIYIPKTPTKQTLITQLIPILEIINSRDNEITILGDLNIDVMKKGTLELEYNQILQSFLLYQTIEEPTRVTPDSQSCIDHVIVNRTECLSESGVIPVGVSDHHLTYSIRKRGKKGGGSKHYEIKTRNFKNYSHDKCKDKLKDKNWRKITQSQDINTAYNMLVDNIISAADDIAPERLLRIKNQCDPWVTGETIHKIHRRDFLLGRAK